MCRVQSLTPETQGFQGFAVLRTRPTVHRIAYQGVAD